MRTIKELLQLMLDNPQLFRAGLCGWTECLLINDLILHQEYWILANYIRDNRPSKYSSLKAFKHRHDQYYWSYGDITPRIKWIKKHIKLN